MAVSLGCLVGSMKSVDAGKIVFATLIPGAQMRSGNHLNYQLQEFRFFNPFISQQKKLLTGIINNLQKNKSIDLVALSKTSC